MKATGQVVFTRNLFFFHKKKKKNTLHPLETFCFFFLNEGDRPGGIYKNLFFQKKKKKNVTPIGLKIGIQKK